MTTLMQAAEALRNTPVTTTEQARVRDQCAALVAAAQELRVAIGAVWKLMEAGVIVRNTSHDHKEAGWAMMIPIVQTLASLDEALARLDALEREGK